jgi:hypothetical protein
MEFYLLGDGEREESTGYLYLEFKKADTEEYSSIPVIDNPVLYKDGRLSFWPEGFFDEWDRAIDELF